MRAPRFNLEAKFLRRAASGEDRLGNEVLGDFEILFVSPANLRETPGKERLAAGRLEAPVTGTLRIRSSLDGPGHTLTSADRVEVKGQTWKILTDPIDPEGLGRMLEFTIERGSLTA